LSFFYGEKCFKSLNSGKKCRYNINAEIIKIGGGYRGFSPGITEGTNLAACLKQVHFQI